jgi:hypothetical protein
MPNTTAHQRRLSRIARKELVEAANSIAGFTVTRPEFGSAANVSGVRSKTLTFSQRHDSRTLFAMDTRYGHLRKLGAWTGSDRTAVAACRRVLRAAKVPRGQIETIDVLSEYGQVAERASEGDFHLHEPSLLRKVARARRVIDGIPVWSSYTSIGLTADGEVGWIELHWPDVTSAVIKEAHLLVALLKHGYELPELPDARVESAEPGVIHSPAIGLFMDAAAAVRVTYTGVNPAVGRKATLYLDRHGEPVAHPRDIEPAKPDTTDRPEPDKASRRKPH